jgi:hypothetical protein
VLGLGKLGYVCAGILESDRLAATRQRYRIVKPTFPAAAHSRINGRCGG